MLIQSSSIFVRNTFPVLHIKGYYADFILVAKVITQLGLNINTISCHTTHMTSRSSRRGTISSTNVFGVLPSAVTPVAQHWIVVKLMVHAGEEGLTCSTFATEGSLCFSNMSINCCAILRCTENFDRCSWNWGRVAIISRISSKLCGPALQVDSVTLARIRMKEATLERRYALVKTY